MYKCDESNDVEKEMKYAEQSRSRYAMVINCNINNLEYYVRRRFRREPIRIPVKALT